jgi:fido (protein-threonine AMPylation protein)
MGVLVVASMVTVSDNFRKTSIMPQMEGRPSPHRWNQIRKLPLLPQIQTLAQYEEAVLCGGVEALAHLRGIEPLCSLTVGDVRRVHRLMFRGVHPWAGDFREPGQLATVAGFPAADPPRIGRELELALFQTRELVNRAIADGDRHLMLAGLAYFHVRYERVHPFVDGNGRSGRAILAVQFEKAFGALPRFSNQTGYREAMRAADRRELAPLINYLGASAGLPPVGGAWPSPFRVSPRFLEPPADQTTFEDDLAWSRL